MSLIEQYEALSLSFSLIHPPKPVLPIQGVCHRNGGDEAFEMKEVTLRNCHEFDFIRARAFFAPVTLPCDRPSIDRAT